MLTKYIDVATYLNYKNMRTIRPSISSLIVIAILAIPCSSHAATGFKVSTIAGLSFNGIGPMSAGNISYGAESNKSFRLGLDATYKFPVTDYVEFGAFYDHNFLATDKAGITGHANYFGGIIRIRPPFFLGLFGDIRLGVTNISGSNFDSGLQFGYGLGIGYNIPILPTFSISPYIGSRRSNQVEIPGTGLKVGTSFLDFALMASLEI